MQIIKHSQNEEEREKRISLPQTRKIVKETMTIAIYHYRIQVVGDIIMDKFNPMLRETKMPKNKVEASLGDFAISFNHI